MNAPPPATASRPAVFAAGALLAIAALAAYANTFAVPFVYDDGPAIVDNATLRHFAAAFFPPPDTTASGRPLVNLSFAFNYALSGSAVWSYHALNLFIHVGAGLALFGIVRRTLAPRNIRHATAVAGAAALLWTVHPLQTESVTYVVQRAESLMGMFYLLTLYCFVRAVDCQSSAATMQSEGGPCAPRAAGMTDAVKTARGAPGPPTGFRTAEGESLRLNKHGLDDDRPVLHEGNPQHRHLTGDRASQQGKWWRAAAVAACLAGMACKEVMVSAPLMVLLYDRTFVAGSVRLAWRRRKSFYAALAGTWILLALLVASTGGNRSGTVGFDVGVPWWAYWVTQFRALTHYLALTFWPRPLIFEYGTFWETSGAVVVPRALFVLALLGATVAALWRRPALGFVGAWFFVMLAPTSLLPGTTQMIVEHRMYLSLAAALVFAVVVGHAWFGARSLGVFFGAAVVLLGLTFARNADYRSELALWSDTVAKRPTGALAHCNLAIALVKQQRLPEAIAHYEQSLALAPNASNTHYNYALALTKIGRVADAVAHYEHALRVKPDFASAQCNLGTLLFQNGRAAEAIPHYERAVRLTPDDSDTQCNLANALCQTGRAPEALQHYERALALRPNDADHHYNFANTLLQLGRIADAIGHYEKSLGLRPNDPDAYCNLGVALERAGRPGDAITQWRTALQLRPNHAAARENLDRLQVTPPADRPPD